MSYSRWNFHRKSAEKLCTFSIFRTIYSGSVFFTGRLIQKHNMLQNHIHDLQPVVKERAAVFFVCFHIFDRINLRLCLCFRRHFHYMPGKTSLFHQRQIWFRCKILRRIYPSLLPYSFANQLNSQGCAKACLRHNRL